MILAVPPAETPSGSSRTTGFQVSRGGAAALVIQVRPDVSPVAMVPKRNRLGMSGRTASRFASTGILAANGIVGRRLMAGSTAAHNMATCNMATRKMAACMTVTSEKKILRVKGRLSGFSHPVADSPANTCIRKKRGEPENPLSGDMIPGDRLTGRSSLPGRQISQRHPGGIFRETELRVLDVLNSVIPTSFSSPITGGEEAAIISIWKFRGRAVPLTDRITGNSVHRPGRPHCSQITSRTGNTKAGITADNFLLGINPFHLPGLRSHRGGGDVHRRLSSAEAIASGEIPSDSARPWIPGDSFSSPTSFGSFRLFNESDYSAEHVLCRRSGVSRVFPDSDFGSSLSLIRFLT